MRKDEASPFRAREESLGFEKEEEMAVVMFVDGPNFLNRVIDIGKTSDYIKNTLDFPTINALVQRKVKDGGLYSHPFLRTMFYYSNLPKLGPFEGKEKDSFIKKLSTNQRGVTTKPVELSTERTSIKRVVCSKCGHKFDVTCPNCGEVITFLGREKAVDTTIITDMFELFFLLRDGGYQPTFVLFSSDKDYVPAVKALSNRGAHMVSVGYKGHGHPDEIINESYLFLGLKEILKEMEKALGDEQ